MMWSNLTLAMTWSRWKSVESKVTPPSGPYDRSHMKEKNVRMWCFGRDRGREGERDGKVGQLTFFTVGPTSSPCRFLFFFPILS